MLASLLGALSAIPSLVTAVRDLIGWFEKAERLGWFSNLNQAVKDTEAAQTPNEKQNAAKEIQDSISHL